MNKEITITNANNQEKFICFRLNGLKDGIMVGLYPKMVIYDRDGDFFKAVTIGD